MRLNNTIYTTVLCAVLAAATGCGTSNSDAATTGSSSAGTISAADMPTGFAGYSASSNFGGYGGTVYSVSTYADLKSALSASDSSRIIYVTGMIDLCNGQTGYDFITTAGYSGTYSSYSDYQTKFAASCTNGSAATLASVQEKCAAVQAAVMVLSVPSNTTIIGTGSDCGFKNGSFSISGVSNIAVRNVIIQDAYDWFPSWYQSSENNFNSEYDCITVYNSTNIWIDHCTLQDSAHTYTKVTTASGSTDWVTYDALIDTVNGSNYCTYSYNKFYNHDKTSLIGNSDSKTSDSGKLKVTLHHNYYLNCTQRLPRVRFGEVHVYNNYYSGIGSYCIGVGYNAQIYCESNYFSLSSGKYAAELMSSSKKGYIQLVNNEGNCGSGYLSSITSSTVDWDPSAGTYYSYTVDSASDLPSLIPANAGAGVWTVSQ